jgi:hypothetical protein
MAQQLRFLPQGLRRGLGSNRILSKRFPKLTAQLQHNHLNLCPVRTFSLFRPIEHLVN